MRNPSRVKEIKLSRKTHATLAAIATAGSLLVYSVVGAPAIAQTAGSGYVQLAAAYSQVVRNLQYELNRSGYDAGPVDGLMGSRTRAAIGAYQRANGLLVTNQPSESLLEHIRASATMQQPVPQPPTVSKQTIFNIQSELRRRGYDIAVVDGEMDDETAAAIRRYQRDSNLTITGKATDSLLADMRYQAQQQATPAPTMVSKQTIIDIQSELRRRGYDISVIDGEMDDETAAAIRRYQRDSSLTITGKATDSLLANLRYQAQQPQPDYRDRVRDVQQALNARGYNAGPADGVMGPSTRNAIRTYQVDAGDKVTGQIDTQLLARLELVAADSGGGGQEVVDHGKGRGLVVALSEEFADGNYTANPAWTVYQGSFRIDKRSALRSTVNPPQPPAAASQQSTGDISKDLLFAMLEQAFQSDQRNTQAEAGPTQATIGTLVPIDSDFRMRVQIRAHSDDGRFVFGPYQDNVNNGYLLAYSLDNDRPALRLLSVTGGQTRLVAEAIGVPSLDDGQVHEIDWMRDRNGRMAVSVDGTHVLQATSNVYRDDFDGFAFTNLGGDFGIQKVRIDQGSRRYNQSG